MFIFLKIIVLVKFSRFHSDPVIEDMEFSIRYYIFNCYLSLSLLSFVLMVSAGVGPLGLIGSLIMPFATGVLYGLMSLGRKVYLLRPFIF